MTETTEPVEELDGQADRLVARAAEVQQEFEHLGRAERVGIRQPLEIAPVSGGLARARYPVGAIARSTLRLPAFRYRPKQPLPVRPPRGAAIPHDCRTTAGGVAKVKCSRLAPLTSRRRQHHGAQSLQ